MEGGNCRPVPGRPHELPPIQPPLGDQSVDLITHFSGVIFFLLRHEAYFGVPLQSGLNMGEEGGGGGGTYLGS